jgi:hypothetical protein
MLTPDWCPDGQHCICWPENCCLCLGCQHCPHYHDDNAPCCMCGHEPGEEI